MADIRGTYGTSQFHALPYESALPYVVSVFRTVTIWQGDGMATFFCHIDDVKVTSHSERMAVLPYRVMLAIGACSMYDSNDNDYSNDMDMEIVNENCVATKAKKRKTTRRRPRRILYNWSNPAVVSKLIALVEQRRELWDAGDPAYKLPKTQAWEEVAHEIGAGVNLNDVKVKWMNLRVTFRTNVAKLRAKKSGQSSSESATVVWRHFKEMQFLDDVEVSQSSMSPTSFILPNSPGEYVADEQLSPIPTVVGQRRKRTIHSLSSTSSFRGSLREMAAEALANLAQQKDENIYFADFITNECNQLTSIQASELRLRVHKTVADYKAELHYAESMVAVPPEAAEN